MRFHVHVRGISNSHGAHPLTRTLRTGRGWCSSLFLLLVCVVVANVDCVLVVRCWSCARWLVLPALVGMVLPVCPVADVVCAGAAHWFGCSTCHTDPLFAADCFFISCFVAKNCCTGSFGRRAGLRDAIPRRVSSLSTHGFAAQVQVCLPFCVRDCLVLYLVTGGGRGGGGAAAAAGTLTAGASVHE